MLAGGLQNCRNTFSNPRIDPRRDGAVNAIEKGVEHRVLVVAAELTARRDRGLEIVSRRFWLAHACSLEAGVRGEITRRGVSGARP